MGAVLHLDTLMDSFLFPELDLTQYIEHDLRLGPAICTYEPICNLVNKI